MLDFGTGANMFSRPPMTEARPQLLDRLQRPLRELRISVTDRCNFRCSYCMPEDVYDEGYRFMRRAEILRFEEITRLARLAVQRLGVRKLRLTGGEPLTRRELPALIQMLAAIDGLQDLALTTNGSLLAFQADALARAGLRRATVSLDALDAPTFAKLSGGRGDVAEVLRGIEAAQAAGLSPVKINCVVQRGVNEHAVRALAERFRGRGVVVRFIEFMDVGTRNAWQPDSVVGADEICAMLEGLGTLERLPATHHGEVAQRYAYADGQGEVGVIAAVTSPFCGDCSRARLSADGRLLNCLFAEHGTDLRAPMRDGVGDDALVAAIERAWGARGDRYSEQRAERWSRDGRRRLEMYQVGG